MSNVLVCFGFSTVYKGVVKEYYSVSNRASKDTVKSTAEMVMQYREVSHRARNIGERKERKRKKKHSIV